MIGEDGLRQLFCFLECNVENDGLNVLSHLVNRQAANVRSLIVIVKVF